MVVLISKIRVKQRHIIYGTLLICLVLFFGKYTAYLLPPLDEGLEHQSPAKFEQNNCHLAPSIFLQTVETNITYNRTHEYHNLNSLDSTKYGSKNQEHLLVLTTLQNDEEYLENYFQLLDKSTYPNNLISIGLLVSDSTDNTLEKLHNTVNLLQSRWRSKFYEISVYQKNFGLDSKKESSLLDSKRAGLARAKNFLLLAALREHHSWVAWVDVRLHSYPDMIFSDLMLVNEDVIVPNTLMKRDDLQFWGFDRNNWQETKLSLEKQINLDSNEMLMEDYNEYSIGRSLLVDMSTRVDKYHKVPLDGVGSTFILVKATVHREGAVFPPFVYQHLMDSEAFAKIVKSMGFSVYGLPGYIIHHI